MLERRKKTFKLAEIEAKEKKLSQIKYPWHDMVNIIFTSYEEMIPADVFLHEYKWSNSRSVMISAVVWCIIQQQHHVFSCVCVCEREMGFLCLSSHELMSNS